MSVPRSSFRFLLALACLAPCTPILAAEPPPPTAAAEKRFIAYKITRGDRVSVSVVGEPELTVVQKRVESTGTINLLYIGNIRLVGLTIAEAQDFIAQSYRDGRFLRNPQVSVTVDEYAPRIVRIGGKVNAPGQIPIPPDAEMTIIEVIFKANGLTETARSSAVRVTRTMPDGTEKLFTLDLEAALKARGKSTGDGSFVVQPDDVVYVPEKFI